MHSIIIDGYNLLFYSNRFAFPLKEGKTVVDAITDMLKEFQIFPYKMKSKFTFVFDGNKDASGNPKVQNIFGFKLIFSVPGKTADQKIIEIVRASKNPKSILVVTNDNEIINSVSFYKAKTESISSFLKRLADQIQEKSDKDKSNIEKFNPKLTDDDLDEWMEYFSVQTKQKSSLNKSTK
jgi:predicted RNA-binding protein with PIN domain